MTSSSLDEGLIFQQASNFSLNGFAVISAADDTLLKLNPALCDMLGYKEEELLHVPFPVITDRDPYRPSFYRQAADRCKAQPGYMEEIEKRLLHKDGRFVWVRMRLSTVRDPQTDEALYLCAEMLDITSLKTERIPVLDNRHLYMLLTRNSHDLVSVSTIEGELQYIAPSCLDVLGYTPEEMAGTMRPSYYHPDDAHEMSEPGKLFSSDRFFLRRVRRKDGRFMWFEVWSQVIWDETDQCDKVLSVARDVSERKEYEDKLDEAQRIAKMGTYELDLASDALALSKGAKRLLGLPEDFEPAGIEDAMLHIPEEDRVHIRQHLNQVSAVALRDSVQYRVVDSDGTVRFLQSNWEVIDGESATPSRLLGSVQDMTERRQFEQRLQESEQRYKSLFEYNQSAVYSMNLKGEYLTANSNLEKLTGYTLEELIGMYYGPLVPPKDVAKTSHHFGLAAQGQAQNYEVTILHKDGREIETNVSNIPIIVDGEVVGVFGISIDVTDRKRAEAKLKESESRYKCLFDLNNTPICSFNLDGSFTKVNPAMTQLTGYTMEELRELTFAPLTHPDDLEALTKRVNLAIRGTPQTYEARLIRKGGEVLDISITNVPIVVDGETVGFYGIASDITASKRHTERINKLNEEHARILNSVSEGIFGLDQDGGFTFINHSGAEMLGLREDRLPDISVLRYLLQTGPDGINYWDEDSPLIRALREGRPHQDKDAIFWRSDGTSFLADYRITPTYDNGVAKGAVVVFRDMTGEKNIIEAKENAERADRAKSEFLSVMSHELRTPMNGVIGMTGLLLDTELTEEQRSYAQVISQSSESLMHILNEILDFSKIEAGKLALHYEPISVRDTAEEVIRLFAPQAAEKQIELGLRFEGDVPDIMIGDPVRLRQVLVNLMSNAVKFTDTGFVFLFVRAMPTRNRDSVLVEFAVQDTGIGIPKDKQSQLFQSFSQLHLGTNRKYGGTGLGLSICKKLVELMGGSIGFDTIEGQGSTFRFTLSSNVLSELAAAAETYAESAPAVPAGHVAGRSAPRFGPMRVLVAEDHAVNQQIIRVMLNKLGYEPFIAADGQTAVDAVLEQRFDIVLMDIQMPTMDGLQATLRIRELVPEPKRPLIVALTAFARQEDREACAAAGMSDYLSKPIRPVQLEELLLKWSEEIQSRRSRRG
ncbi:PAS domain S-box protein [Cohnella sp. 56]|uniref:PAS domain S-box protein n=1 Tax=Cohnella sp. 56 TaxID=3113722 RepID=UPI0030E84A54